MIDADKASVLHAKETRRGCRRSDQTMGGGEGSSERKSPTLNYGHVSMMGRRRVMEDVVTVVPPRKLPGEHSFFAAYHAHGRAKVAEKCNERLYQCLEKHIETTEEKSFDWGKVAMDCFGSMYEDMRSGKEVVEREERSRAAAEGMVKFTAVVVVVGKEEVVLVNYGDSGAVLWSCGVALPLWNDHKPDEADGRVEAVGGRIINWLDGHISTSRSIGDQCLKPCKISEAEVTMVRRMKNSDDFLIIATDGLWNVVSKEIACAVVRKCLGGKMRRLPLDGNGASEAAAILAELAIAKGSRDNISIFILQLK